jgi:serralysin
LGYCGGNDNLPSTGASNAGSDTFWGRDGNDTLVGGAGGDKIDGGAGMDVSSYLSSKHGVTVNLTTGKGAGGDAAGDRLTGVEALTGSSSDDTLTANSGYNVLRGWAGADVLKGMGGHDIINGGAGGDKIDGGDGSDTSSYWGSSHSVVVNLASGEATGGDATGDTLTSIENLKGSSHDDLLTGNGSANVLMGNAGADVLNGMASDDVLEGGDGDDKLLGGSGNDRLAGGRGSDTMSGGVGNDSFVFNTPVGQSNIDAIADFNSGHDRILLDHSIFSKLAIGHLSADNFHTGDAAADGNEYVVYNHRTGGLYYDADGSGSGGAVQIATLVDKPELTRGDVFVV